MAVGLAETSRAMPEHRCTLCNLPDAKWVDRVGAFLCESCRLDSQFAALAAGDLTAFVDPPTREHHTK